MLICSYHSGCVGATSVPTTYSPVSRQRLVEECTHAGNGSLSASTDLSATDCKGMVGWTYLSAGELLGHFNSPNS